MLNKILHLYWGRNKPLSYLRSLTATTFKKLNPDWEVKIWVPKRPSECVTWQSGEHPVDYEGTDYLDTLEGVREMDFNSIGVNCNIPEVHKSDLLRWYLLATEGGIWSDFDIIYINPVTPAMMETWQGAGLCKYGVMGHREEKLYQAIGFLTSEGTWGKRFFFDLFRFGIEKGEQPAYQAFGAHLLDEFLATRWTYKETPFYHDPAIVYHYHDLHNVLNYFTNHQVICDRDKTIGLHWYGGNPQAAKKEVNITPENMGNSHYSICKEAIKVLYPYQYRVSPNIKYSFIMPYYQRSQQLRSTLMSFLKYYKNRTDYEVIIVNDVKNAADSKEETKLLEVVDEFQQQIPIVITEYGTMEAWNPAPAFSVGVDAAAGNYLILTNPECVHRADILAGLDQEFARFPGAYVVCGCFSIEQEKINPDEAIPDGYWYQHSQHRNIEVHFCSALLKDIYFQVGGFDQCYAAGMGFDDDDFRNRLKKAKVPFIHRDDLLTVHLMHRNNMPHNYLELHAINKSYYLSVWGQNAVRAEQQHLGEKVRI